MNLTQFIQYVINNGGDWLPASNGNGFNIYGLKENYDLAKLQQLAKDQGLTALPSPATDDYPNDSIWVGVSKRNSVTDLASTVQTTAS